MLNQEWAFSSLESAILRPRKEMLIGNRTFEAYEPVLIFDSADIVIANVTPEVTLAKGGKTNGALIAWSRNQDISVSLSKGKLSDIGLNLLSNSIAVDYISSATYYVGTSELKQLDSSGRCTLANTPVNDGVYKMFAYDVNSEEELDKKAVTIISGNEVEVTDGEDLVVKIYYYYDYNGDVKEIVLQQKYFNGTFKLEGKTTAVDVDGNERSLFVVFPKISIISSMQVRLGAAQIPNFVQFDFQALEDDYLGEKTSLYYVLLDDKID